MGMHHFVPFLIFFCMIYTASLWPEETISFFLTPYAAAVQLYYHIPMEYQTGVGFVPAGLPFVIGRDCMGVNITAMLFLLMSFLFLGSIRCSKTLWLLFCFAIALVIGFFANLARIILSIPFCMHEKFNMIHAAIGITSHLFVLILCHVALVLYFRRRREHEN